jgi:hypothetical protein
LARRTTALVRGDSTKPRPITGRPSAQPPTTAVSVPHESMWPTRAFGAGRFLNDSHGGRPQAMAPAPRATASRRSHGRDEVWTGQGGCLTLSCFGVLRGTFWAYVLLSITIAIVILPIFQGRTGCEPWPFAVRLGNVWANDVRLFHFSDFSTCRNSKGSQVVRHECSKPQNVSRAIYRAPSLSNFRDELIMLVSFNLDRRQCTTMVSIAS